MQGDPNRELLRTFAERIVNAVFPEETSAARLQQIGMFTLIYIMEKDEEKLTAARLGRFTGLVDSQVLNNVDRLADKDLVVKTPITSKHGRGRSFQLSIKHSPKTRRLLEALEMAPGGERKPNSRKKPFKA
jgi:DNA-binding MarR family transcriptional regulator